MKPTHRTAIFTIHNPTRRVRSILERAFTDYTRAYGEVLEIFQNLTLPELRAMATYHDKNGVERRGAKRLEQRLFVHYDDSEEISEESKISEVDPPLPDRYARIADIMESLEGGMRESLRRHISETLMSYIELSEGQQQSPSYPQHLKPKDLDRLHEETLELIRTIADDLEEEDILRANLLRSKQPDVVPISFCRISAERNCGIFYNEETRTFYARLFVVGCLARNDKPLRVAGEYTDIRNGVTYVSQHLYDAASKANEERDKEKRKVMKSFGGGTRSILVPLEMGRWHEEQKLFAAEAFLPHRTDGKVPAALPVSAKLVRRGENYQLHVAFQFSVPEKIAPKTYIGVNRGIKFLAGGAVISQNGKTIIETFTASGAELGRLQQSIEKTFAIRQSKGKPTKGDRRRSRIADHHVHSVANQIVAKALQHQSRVIMEDLSAFNNPKRRQTRYERKRTMFPRRQYQKLLDIVNMKLNIAGLSPVIIVSPSFISLTCTQCGHIDEKNRVAPDWNFKCIECSYEDHPDVLAGVNIVRKLMWLQLRGKQKKANMPEKERTPWPSFIKDFVKK